MLYRWHLTIKERPRENHTQPAPWAQSMPAMYAQETGEHGCSCSRGRGNPSVHQWVNKPDVVDAWDGILFSTEKEGRTWMNL